ncbi:Ig-like domain-containing protein [Colwellia sp. RSH04]|uniref:Ig-like domain-containing protein n=1 Tax=Colwellia sp. RSH04 TaxID=2305464 RepID=UPI000E580120|nr:Ig-like domain-containing protein [Colwellia sp. RSH04]RHW74803.1 hypothetical protein D1094_16775 [Colwellia sp. RSH04]
MRQLIHGLSHRFTGLASCWQQTKKVMLWGLISLCCASSAFAIFGPSIYVGPIPNSAIKHGYVMARAVVLDPATQQPILVQYNTDGSEAGVVNVGGGYNVNELSITSSAAFFAEQQRIEVFELQYKDTLAKGAQLMSREAFLSASFMAADNTTPIVAPGLPSHINSVLVRGQSDRLLPDPSQLVLLSLSFDHTTAQVAEDTISLVVSPQGNILAQSNLRIGYRTGFLGKPNEAQTGGIGGQVGDDETVFGPVPGVKVNVDEFAYYGGVSATDGDGKYGFTFMMPICPVGGFHFKTDVWAELGYSNLLPMGSPAHKYFLRTPGYDYCFADLVPAVLAPSIISILTSISQPVYQNNLYADVMFLTGQMYISNQFGFDIPMGETTHTSFNEVADERLQHFYDFNGDGQGDTVVQGQLVTQVNEEGEEEEVFEANSDGDLQGLYFEAPEADDAPDLLRVIDQEVRKANVGLLESISNADLRNTDVLFFRESTGQLIMERKGLKEAEVGGGEVQLDEAKQLVGYRVMLRGPSDSVLNMGGAITTEERRGGYKEWATEYQLTEPFQKRKSDYIREGETIKIVAINRATGYIGTAKAQIKPQSRGDLTVLAPPIALRPPNLKIWAERKYDVEQGLTKGEERLYTIGSEGAALTSDTTVTIYTEWLDEYGNPLPEELGLDNGEQYGFTGRLAKVVAPGQLQGVGAGNDLASFAIAPGRKTQVINVGSNLSTAEHYYVHVIGKAKDQECGSGGSCPSFTELGSKAPYDTRPNLLVPFLVPLPDEDRTWIEYHTYRGLMADEEITDKPNKPLPAYSWAYRPEYQFSQFGLEMQEINATQTDGQGAETSTNLLTGDNPTITSSDDYITALYSLISSNHDRLTAIDGPQELVLALGQEEQLITIGEDKSITFSNIEHLASLDPEDFLSMRLYANNDASNILWEYAFEFLNIESTTIGYENQTEDIWYVTADDPVVEMKASLLGYAYREAGKEPVSVSWQANGAGTFSPATQTSVDLGVFDSTLTMPTTKGATANVSIKLADGSTTAQWKTVEVLAGAAHHLSIIASGQAIGWQQGDVRLDVSVYDQYDNLVEDGTEVEFDILDSFIIKEQQLETIDGKAYIVLTGGEYAINESIVTISSGEASETETLSIQGLEVTLIAGTTQLNKQQTTNVTAKVTTPNGAIVSNVPITFSATRGFFNEQEFLTNGAGSATAQFTAGLNEVTDKWSVQVGYIAANQLEYSVNSGPESINTSDTMLVADEASSGTIDYDHFGVPTSIGYETTATAEIRNSTNTIVTLGDMADPNLEPLVSLTMASFDSTDRFKDQHGLDTVHTSNVTLVHDHPLGAGRSAQFTAEASAVIKANTKFNLIDNIGARIDIKPQGDGTIFEHGNGQTLSFAGNTLTFTVTTETGSYSVEQSNISTEQWYSVATKVANNQIALYVDGNVVTETITGPLVYGASTSIKLGGLSAVMRSFRLYDWTSQPLLSFADGSSSKAISAGGGTVTLQSLGNLDKHHSSSNLQSLRVAIISGDQRNYASLLTKRGYQNIATQYLNTASPETPLAYLNLHNPLSGLVPTAHAWSWDGVWDGVKSTVGFLIPYEDFIIIGEQLVYLVNQDWENFDSSKLAFASLGAATIIPIAKPLKPLLAPIKKMLDGMKKFPAAKHFAGATGTAVKEALSSSTKKLFDLLPFILIAVELYEEPEVFEFIMSAIENEDDLWVWVEYISEVVKVEGGLDALASYNGNFENPNSQFAVNPLSFAVDSAYAKSSSSIGSTLTTRIKGVIKSIDVKDAKQVTGALRAIVKNPTLKMIAAGGQTGLRVFAAVGAVKLGKFVRDSKNWRANRWLVMFSIIYLAEEFEAGRLDLKDDSQLTSLVSNLFSKNISNSNGAVFQIIETAYFHARHQTNESLWPKVAGIDSVRAAYILKDEERAGNPYKRQVDIVLEYPDGTEEWVELKSYSTTTIAKSVKPKSKAFDGANVFREFFHDYRLNNEFITNDSVDKTNILKISETVTTKTNKILTWYYQDYDIPKGTKNLAKAPSEKQVANLAKKLCNKPTDFRIEDYQFNFVLSTRKAVENKCRNLATPRVKLLNTKAYLVEVLDTIGSDFAKDFKDELTGIE